MKKIALLLIVSSLAISAQAQVKQCPSFKEFNKSKSSQSTNANEWLPVSSANAQRKDWTVVWSRLGASDIDLLSPVTELEVFYWYDKTKNAYSASCQYTHGDTSILLNSVDSFTSFSSENPHFYPLKDKDGEYKCITSAGSPEVCAWGNM